ncbi:uncharacterized protein LOC126599177 [Malus sylvestris]|uniref:uncharacterized protein LOC126599177 n=1 Tax=Malus sylvestris TaxID=3752 RepID=UPI0021AC5372|nr:uncharacterized protein LOC126599177 [Malus sylvestris]
MELVFGGTILSLLPDDRVPNRLTMLQKTLFSAMELVINMMREVEVQEKAVDIVQEEASRGGLDIMVKVDDLKRMLAHAKDANDMHAGEVFGEKAILATEARELQSRLLNLSDERDKSLAILNKVDSTSLSCLLHYITVGACSISLIYPSIFRLPHFYAVFFISYSSKTTIV